MSFFKQNKFELIERKIIEGAVPPAEESPQVLTVYDTVSWKLNEKEHRTDFRVMENQQSLLAELKDSHTQIKKPFGLCVSSAGHAKIAAQFASFLYIPAELCRQSDVLEAAANTALPLVIEKGNFLAPNDVGRMLEKIKGADACLVDCGTANGYSDSILDPRSLYFMQKNSSYFGVSLSDLLAPEGLHYSFRPAWLNDEEFICSFIKTARAFGARLFVIKDYGNGKLNSKIVLNKIASE